jgi:glucokinase
MSARRIALGVDIGGTKIAVGALSFDGELLARTTIATRADQGFDGAMARIATAARQVMRAGGVGRAELVGLGVGCAGPVDPERGEVNNPFTLPGWEGGNIVAVLARALAVPVWLENDADVAALGEYHDGAGAGADVLAMLTFGTGVGGALIIRGEIYRGTGGQHPEIGHVPVAARGAACYCGRRGCLESIASGPALAAAAAKAGLAGPAGVFTAAAAGDRVAQRILKPVTQAVGAAAWALGHAYAPARLVLGGGLVEAQPDFFLRAARAAVGGRRLVSGSPLDVAVARLGNRAGLIGAARWALARAGARGSRSPARVRRSRKLCT